METDLSSRVAVLIPCRNEEQTVGAVVDAFRQALPSAALYVFDNCSSDRSVEVALQSGAVVCHVEPAGKGRVVRRMFADVEADVYVLVDGDDTYEASTAEQMVRLVLEGNDMVNAARRPLDRQAFASGHQFGNRMLSGLVLSIFGRRINDTLSGFKALSRRFVKSFPVSSNGFEIEAEMTVHALELTMPVAEVSSPYRSRPTGSKSKLSARRDGIRILRTIVALIRQERPLAFFFGVAAVLAAISLGLAVPVLLTFLHQHRVPRLPTAVLATGIMVLAFLSATAGVILDTVTRGRREAKMLAYLGLPRPGLSVVGDSLLDEDRQERLFPSEGPHAGGTQQPTDPHPPREPATPPRSLVGQPASRGRPA